MTANNINSVDNYVKMFEALSDESKMEVFERITDVMGIRYVIEKSPKRDDKLEAFLSTLSGDWGGDGDARDIADDLWMARVNTKTVEVW